MARDSRWRAGRGAASSRRNSSALDTSTSFSGTRRKPPESRPRAKCSRPSRAGAEPSSSSRSRFSSASVGATTHTSWSRPTVSSSSRTRSRTPVNRSTLSTASAALASSPDGASAASVTDGKRPIRANTSSGSSSPAAPSRCHMRCASSASSPGSTSTQAEPGGSRSVNGVRRALPSGRSTRAVTSTACSSATLRCDTVSNVRSESISSPSNSMRTGRSQSAANRSTIPPRRAKLPGESMASAASQPRAPSQSARSPGSRRAPFSSRRVLEAISRGSTSGASRAWMLVTTSAGAAEPGSASRLTMASRSASAGSVPAGSSSPRLSAAGRSRLGTSLNKARSSTKASASAACGRTMTSGPAAVRFPAGDRRDVSRAATVSADADPQVPPIVPPCPPWRLATTSANPRCDSSVSARPSKRPAWRRASSATNPQILSVVSIRGRAVGVARDIRYG